MANPLRGVALVAHGGGPTTVINSTLAGIVEQARDHLEIRAVYGAQHGLEGILAAQFFDLTAQPAQVLEEVAVAPSSALGTSRRALSDQDFERLLDVFRAHDVRFFFYNGGNGSMDTAMRIDAFARDLGYELRVIGVPKTIDNDLAGTDHTPGYGSTARFFACALRDIGADNRALPTPVNVVEVLGRNTGWLAAATSLARHHEDDPPHLIYLPERPLAPSQLLTAVETVYRRLGRVVVAVCEGQLDDRGEPFGADVRPASRRPLAMNLAHVLAKLITRETGIAARGEKPGLLGRSSAAFVSTVDRAEARLCGRAAVLAALTGETGKMVALVREPAPGYRISTALVDLAKVAGKERPFPALWMDPSGHDVLPEFRDYALPLIGGIRPHGRLQPIFVTGK